MIGSHGYIGKNLWQFFNASKNKVISIDSRNEEFRKITTNQNELIFDCSRLRNFTNGNIEKDEKNHLRLLNWAAENNIRYVRIGSNLEVSNPSEESDYIKWSKNKTDLTLQFKNQINFKVLFIPNIFGGLNSRSIIDQIIASYLKSQKLILRNPKISRDFLCINSFLEIVKLFSIENLHPEHREVLLTSGTKVQIDSIQKYLLFHGKYPLHYSIFESSKEIQTLQSANTVEKYLKNCLD